jgi:hypothetical protein
MAIFQTTFTTPGNYTYDSDKIEVSGGLAKLKALDLATNLHAYWKFNESVWNGTTDEVVDSSGNGYHCTAKNGANTVAGGKIGRAGSFDGVNDYVISSNNAGITGNPSFSISMWMKVPSGGVRSGSYPLMLYWGVAVNTNCFHFGTYTIGRNRLYIGVQGGGQYSPIFTWDVWHHFVWVRVGGGNIRTGNTVYIDNVPVGLSNTGSNLIPNVTNAPFEMQRGGTVAYMECFVDELALWNNRTLTSGEVSTLYNANAGQEIYKYSADNPGIYKTAGDSDVISSWNGFTVTEGTVEGSLRYQLSSDGVIWYYWNGAWSVAGASDYNTEATVNSNISAFPTAPDKIYVKTFLISDGLQSVEIDLIEINYTSNQTPLVNAGTNKTCKDNQSISPFSDCSFSDVDGTVDFARYKVDGEVDVWTNIPQGGYATLLEATQAFTYAFNNTGTLTVRLQVEDNIGATADDNLTVTVTQYTRTVNIRHPVTNEHIAVIDFNPGDGSGFALQNSPFTYSWNYGTFNLIMQSEGFYSKVQSELVDTEADLDLTMEPIVYDGLDGKVYIDTVNGVVGTDFPTGTFNKPVSNWTDAKAIADNSFIKRFVLRGNLILGPSDDIGGYEFSGDTAAGVRITLGGGNTTGAIFNRLLISGSVNGAINIYDRSQIDEVTNFEGEIHNSGFKNADPTVCLTLGGSTTPIIVGCWSEVPGAGSPIIDMGGDGRGLNVRAYSGGLKLINKTGSESVTLEYIAGQAKFDSTVTNGYITVRGIVKIAQDDSGPNCTVDSIVGISNRTIWAELLSNNQTSGSFGELIQSVMTGKWDLNVNVTPMLWTFYKLDGVTILQQFELGTASKNVQPIVSRTPV